MKFAGSASIYMVTVSLFRRRGDHLLWASHIAAEGIALESIEIPLRWNKLLRGTLGVSAQRKWDCVGITVQGPQTGERGGRLLRTAGIDCWGNLQLFSRWNLDDKILAKDMSVCEVSSYNQQPADDPELWPPCGTTKLVICLIKT